MTQSRAPVPPTPSAAAIPLLPLALLGGTALAFEVLLTKFLAYSVAALLVYVVLGIALLGFGAAGTLAAAYPEWASRASAGDRLGWASLVFSTTLLVVFALFVRITPQLTGQGVATFAAALLLTLPFLAAGLAVALALSRAPVGRAYAANLVGSALGCIAPLLLLPWLGGQRLMAVLAGLGWIAAWLFVRGSPTTRAFRVVSRATLALAIAAIVWAPALYSPLPEPAPHGQLELVRRHADAFKIRETRVYDRWNAVGRIEIFRYDGVPDARTPYPFLFYVQDSSAGSTLAQWDGKGEGTQSTELARACEDTVWGQAYFAPRNDVLVIGLGGGMDVQCALRHDARTVDVVEINPSAIAAIRGRFDAFVGGIGTNPRVAYHLGDGRSFVHRLSHRSYDVIQLSGVDTKNSSSSGGIALSENTLYTLEAFHDYLGNLSPSGVLSIVRFSDAEAVRLSNTAVTALRQLGVTDPERHVIVLSNSYVRGILVSRSPFNEQDVATIMARYRKKPGVPYGVNIFFYEAMDMDFRVPPVLDYAPGHFTAAPASVYFAALGAGLAPQFFDRYPFDVAPATDDRPFFFDVFLYRDETAWQYPHVRSLGFVLGCVLALGVVLVLLPVLRARFRVRGAPVAVAVFFSALGLAYLFVEVWAIHEFGMYLGHQAYSLGIVLSALLLSTGAGAYFGEVKLGSIAKNVGWGTVGIVTMLAFGRFVLPAILGATASAGLPLRIVVVLAYTFVLGGCMGLPFPAGLRWARRDIAEAVPWYLGINGFSSVVATIAVVPISHALGYGAVALGGGALYVIAWLVAGPIRAKA